jgi:hypothetical protein
MVIITDAEDSTERHHRISDLAAPFVDHHVVHLTEALALSIVNIGSLNLSC